MVLSMDVCFYNISRSYFLWSFSGDISYGRLETIPFETVQWYHLLAPLALVILTRFGIPVSTSFLVLSVFASSFILEKMLIKSFMGYGVAAIFAYVVWLVVSKFINEKSNQILNMINYGE